VLERISCFTRQTEIRVFFTELALEGATPTKRNAASVNKPSRPMIMSRCRSGSSSRRVFLFTSPAPRGETPPQRRRRRFFAALAKQAQALVDVLPKR
jgi:hypothetical protein